MLSPRKLKESYDRGENIAKLLREGTGEGGNTEEAIEAAYDLQAGTYVAALKDPGKAAQKAAYVSHLVEVLRPLGGGTVFEAGVGEATTVVEVSRQLPGHAATDFFGIDLSWSRIHVARQYAERRGAGGMRLAVGSLLQLPFQDDAIDLVYTAHSVEPNGGKEEEILEELYRVARRHLVLLEPAYELANDEAKRRMEEHGYCRGIPDICERKGWDVIEHRLFGISINPLNPTGLTVIRKAGEDTAERGDGGSGAGWACPRFGGRLEDLGSHLFSRECFTAYPKIDGIPCLRPELGVLAFAHGESLESLGCLE